MSPTKVLDSMADAIVGSLGGRAGKALSPTVINCRLAKVNRRANNRARQLAKTQAYRQRWIQLSEDEIVDLIERRQQSAALTR